MGYGLDGLGSISGKGKTFFSAPQRSNRFSGSLRVIFNGYRGIFSRGVKRPRRKPNHSPPSSAEVKNGGSLPPFPHTLHGVVLK
jgi:hypothetical protein